jgi:hypothetical protein
MIEVTPMLLIVVVLASVSIFMWGRSYERKHGVYKKAFDDTQVMLGEIGRKVKLIRHLVEPQPIKSPFQTPFHGIK